MHKPYAQQARNQYQILIYILEKLNVGVALRDFQYALFVFVVCYQERPVLQNHIRERWPDSLFTTWPIQELVYLSPSRYLALNDSERKIAIQQYWQANDPTLCDGKGAESFVDFLARVQQFHMEVEQLSRFIVVVGHRMFFRAYQFCLMHGFDATPGFMSEFHRFEITHPIQNGEILKTFIRSYP